MPLDLPMPSDRCPSGPPLAAPTSSLAPKQPPKPYRAQRKKQYRQCPHCLILSRRITGHAPEECRNRTVANRIRALQTRAAVHSHPLPRDHRIGCSPGFSRPPPLRLPRPQPPTDAISIPRIEGRIAKRVKIYEVEYDPL